MSKEKKNTKSKIVTVFFILLVAVVAALVVLQRMNLLFFEENSQQKAAPEKKENVINVEVLDVHPEDFVKTTAISGELVQKSSEYAIIPEITSSVVSVNVAKGTYVQKGDVLAVCDPSVPGSKYVAKEIKAPFSGTVTAVLCEEGRKVSANEVLFKIGNPENLILSIKVPEKYLSSVSVGTKAVFTTAAWPEKQYEATVAYMAGEVSPATRTVACELEINNPDEKLLSGMFVKVRLETLKLNKVFVVPTVALSEYLNDDILYLVKDGRAVRTVVKAGVYDDSRTVIESGLHEGDTVVVLGNVAQASPVNIVNR